MIPLDTATISIEAKLNGRKRSRQAFSPPSERHEA